MVVVVVVAGRAIVRVSDIKRAHGISRARGVYGVGSLIRPKGKKKKKRAMASITTSASLALLHVTVATLVHLFLY